MSLFFLNFFLTLTQVKLSLEIIIRYYFWRFNYASCFQNLYCVSTLKVRNIMAFKDFFIPMCSFRIIMFKHSIVSGKRTVKRSLPRTSFREPKIPKLSTKETNKKREEADRSKTSSTSCTQQTHWLRQRKGPYVTVLEISNK